MAGFAADTRQLHALGDQLHAAGVALAELDPANRDAAGLVLHATRPPRATGFMANHLTARATGAGVTFASTARYWTFVHWGAPRRHLRARPWYVETVHASREQLLAVYAQHARRALEHVTT